MAVNKNASEPARGGSEFRRHLKLQEVRTLMHSQRIFRRVLSDGVSKTVTMMHVRVGLAPAGLATGMLDGSYPESARKSLHGQKKEKDALLSHSEECVLRIVPLYKNG